MNHHSTFFANQGPAFKNQGYTTGSGPLPTDRLTVPTKDALFLYQLQRPDPTALGQETLCIAKICETDFYAHRVYKELKKIGIIDANNRPDTTKIDKTMVSKISIISVPKQRELVDMLFFWEEELVRWNLLDKEIESLLATIKDGRAREDDEAIQEQLNVLEAKKKVVPSLRRQDGTIKEVAGQQPPEYHS